MSRVKLSYFDREMLKELRLRLETNDPLYFGLKKLSMRGKDLKAIPHVLFTMMELEVLELSPDRQACLNFRLPLVPPSIGKLINLRVLMLDTNELDQLPKELCLLQSLERLSLSNNALTSLPHGIGRLKFLRSVHLANNKFDSFPLELCDVEMLEFLDLSCNFLVTIPNEISKLSELRTLLLNYNKLMQLPDSLCNLVDLECLWLGNNRLKSLPRNFGKLQRLDWGYRYTSSVLEKNPLVNPPLEICRKGPREIEHYFEDLDEVREINTPEFEQDEFKANETEDELGNIVADDMETPIADDNRGVSITVTSPEGETARAT